MGQKIRTRTRQVSAKGKKAGYTTQLRRFKGTKLVGGVGALREVYVQSPPKKTSPKQEGE